MIRRKGDLLTYLYEWLGSALIRAANRRRQRGHDWNWRWPTRYGGKYWPWESDEQTYQRVRRNVEAN